MTKTSLLALCLLVGTFSFAQSKRYLQPNDFLRVKDISEPQVSPDGKWVVYTISEADTSKDHYINDVWMNSWDGTQQIQLTHTKNEDESSPRFSSDNKYISFLSDRYSADEKKKNTQLWVMDRRGGEAWALTDFKQPIVDYKWSPDGSHILFVLKDRGYSDTSSSGIRDPYEIDRYLFKRDVNGYGDTRKTHLYLFHLNDKKLDTLTNDARYNETSPAFSPDGKEIAFVSNRTDDPDRNENSDIWIMPARKGGKLKQLTTWKGEDDSPVWSADGKFIAYLQSSSDEKFTMYGNALLAIANTGTGEVKILSNKVDRPVYNLRWNKNSTAVYCLMDDDRQQLIASFNVNDGTFTRVADGEKVFSHIELNEATGDWLTSLQTPYKPNELYVLENAGLRALTHIQDTFINALKPLQVEGFTSTSKDGTSVSGILYRRAEDVNKKLPLILFIHGGPVSQNDYRYDMYRNILASAGYAVAAVNYRGSNGRGVDFIRAIYADWGNKEVVDIIGAADYLIKAGIADENRMGIGGWSYGGILTNYTIATDNRFKAAASGAGSSLQLSMYGSDQYVVQYETELGAPWKNMEKWIQVSYPFFHADRIKTPTLFMASEKDFNVPVAGAEQMYQALRSLGVPTKLVIYPDQFHSVKVPSYLVHRFRSYIDWFDKYLKP